MIDRHFYADHDPKSDDTVHIKKNGPTYAKNGDGGYQRRRGKLVEEAPAHGKRWYVNFVSPFTGVSWCQAFDDREDAVAWQRRLNAPGWEHDEQNILTSRARAAVPTFAKAAEDYVNYRTPRWRPATRDQVRRSLELRILPAIGDQRLDRITADTLQSMIDSWPVSGTTASGTWDVVVAIFRDAERRGVITGSPIPRVQRPRKDTPVRARVLDPGEVERLIAAAPEHYRVLFQVAAATGLRRGELGGLQVRDIHLDARVATISVRQQITKMVNGTPRFAAPKSAAGVRSVPLPFTLARLLRQYVNGRDPDSLLFTDELGRALGPHAMNRIWVKVASTSGLELPERTGWHVLRHSYVSRAVAMGIPIPTVARAAGHDAVVLQRTYAHDDSALLSRMASASDVVAPPMYEIPEAILERRRNAEPADPDTF